MHRTVINTVSEHVALFIFYYERIYFNVLVSKLHILLHI
jgi:hypothetical protein